MKSRTRQGTIGQKSLEKTPPPKDRSQTDQQESKLCHGPEIADTALLELLKHHLQSLCRCGNCNGHNKVTTAMNFAVKH